MIPFEIFKSVEICADVPCLLVLLPFVVFLSIRSPFVTENQLQVSNKLMEHGTNGTTCHQEHLRLNEDGIAGRS